MCDNCAEARKHAEQVASDMSRAEKSREFYRRQGECRERERIIKLLTAELTQKTMIWDEAVGHPIFVNQADLLIALIKGENK